MQNITGISKKKKRDSILEAESTIKGTAMNHCPKTVEEDVRVCLLRCFVFVLFVSLHVQDQPQSVSDWDDLMRE